MKSKKQRDAAFLISFTYSDFKKIKRGLALRQMVCYTEIKANKCFGNNGQMLKGKYGTNPYAIKRYFEKEGYKVKVVEGEKITKEKLPKADAYIVSFWNSNDVMEQLHTVAIRKKSNGKYELFNFDMEKEEAEEVENLRERFMEEEIVPLTVHCILK